MSVEVSELGIVGIKSGIGIGIVGISRSRSRVTYLLSVASTYCKETFKTLSLLTS